MYTDDDKKRVAGVNRMILEMAGGNFSYSIERSNKNDDLETHVVLLNMLAEEMREIFNHYAFINPHETYRHSVQMSFILNKDFIITGYSPSVKHMLLMEDHELVQNYFRKLLTNESLDCWDKEQPVIIKDPAYSGIIKLCFKTNNTLNVPLFCSISSIVTPGEESKIYIVNALLTIIRSKENENRFKQTLQSLEKNSELSRNAKKVAKLRRETDIERIRNVYDHILNNLEEPLLNLKGLANKFGTNEFKLKIGFKQLYNTTVFKLQKEERLKRAHYMIQNLDQPLKVLPSLLGFQNYGHFSRIFKERYGYTPKTLKNQSFKK